MKNIFRGRTTPEKILDTTPVEMPLGYSTPTPLQDLIASMVHDAVTAENNQEYETPEEADDFEMPDEGLLNMSAYTFDELEDEYPIEQSDPDPEPIPDPEPPPTPPEEPPVDAQA